MEQIASFGGMEQTADKKWGAPSYCPCCRALVRLVGSEPHPVESKTDLLTYVCTGCGDVVVVPVGGLADA